MVVLFIYILFRSVAPKNKFLQKTHHFQKQLNKCRNCPENHSFYDRIYIFITNKKIIVGSLSDVGHIYHPSRTKRMDHIYEEIIAGSCKKMKFVQHNDRRCAAPTPCKRNVNMLHTPCRHGRRVVSPCQSLGIDMTPKKMPLTSTSLLNNRICMDSDDSKISLSGATKHLKTQGIKHMIFKK